jgi:hypothetical protein
MHHLICLILFLHKLDTVHCWAFQLWKSLLPTAIAFSVSCVSVQQCVSPIDIYNCGIMYFLTVTTQTLRSSWFFSIWWCYRLRRWWICSRVVRNGAWDELRQVHGELKVFCDYPRWKSCMVLVGDCTYLMELCFLL